MKLDGFDIARLDGLKPVPVRGQFIDLVRAYTGETVPFPFLHCEGWLDVVPAGLGGPGYVPILAVHGMPRAWYREATREWQEI